MRLLRFVVTDFRSVEDSGWIETDPVAALIGVNESGKTNLLLPLWKLNPAREGEIHPNSDYPKKKFGEIRENPGDYCFIKAEFATDESAARIAGLSRISPEEAAIVQVERYFDGKYLVSFPNYVPLIAAKGSDVLIILNAALQDISSSSPLKQEVALHDTLVGKFRELAEGIEGEGTLDAQQVNALRIAIDETLPQQPAKTSTIVPRAQQASEALSEMHARITKADPQDNDGVFDAVLEALPKFVYYSNYGNLDSEIYLPHVVQNLERIDLGAKEAAKARTLRVLFRFVRLEPHEILELGQDFKDSQNPAREPTEEEIAEITERKRERSILLQSAGTTLTSKFKNWWKQGDYRFRFEADGNHFRIWVSDDRRPEEVELESRSTGLQWFLSFYLVFLVESLGEHKKAILLLDEPGLSLHPLAQRNLSAFFDGLAQTNQILYTTHSPFLVDADRLERARKVYVDEDGTTKATPDLRQGHDDAKQAGAAYAVHSALNLSVAESLLLGCKPVIVEGPRISIILPLSRRFSSAQKKLLLRANSYFLLLAGLRLLA
jgi:energy-coupling factor transporter ATP-binding protein EcfA2